MSRISQRARNMFADALVSQGPGWRNAADAVRTGYENIWITAGLLATERALQSGPDDDEEDDLAHGG